MAVAMDARRILANLIGFPTVSRDSNLALVDWVEGYLSDLGVTAHRVCNAEGTKASLYASVGPQVEGGVMLSGHTDVVPVDGQVWTSDPWTMTERGGRLYGRGSCDMKGFVPPLRPEPSGAAEVLVRRLTCDYATHVVSYGTEAGQFRAAGYSTVVCGPGDIAQAHQPDEFIEISEFEAGAAFMKRLVADLAR